MWQSIQVMWLWTQITCPIKSSNLAWSCVCVTWLRRSCDSHMTSVPAHSSVSQLAVRGTARPADWSLVTFFSYIVNQKVPARIRICKREKVTSCILALLALLMLQIYSLCGNATVGWNKNHLVYLASARFTVPLKQVALDLKTCPILVRLQIENIWKKQRYSEL